MKKLIAIVLAAMVSFGLIGCGSSGSDKSTYELKISTTQTDTSMIYKGLEAAANKIMAETDGNVKVTIYPAGSLGVEEDMIDQALAGIGVAVLTDAGRMSSYIKDIGIFNMAYLVNDYQEGLEIMATDTFQGWSSELVGKGIRILTFNYYDGARSFMGNKRATVPADLNGQVTRTPGADPYNASISAMGATPYNVSWGEVYNGIQTKAIDACEVQYTSAVSSKIFEVCSFVNKTEHIHLFNCLITGEKWFSKLPEEYQAIVLNAFDTMAYENALEIIAAQDVMEKTLADNGMEIVQVEIDQFKEPVNGAYEKLGWAELRQQLYAEAGLNQ